MRRALLLLALHVLCATAALADGAFFPPTGHRGKDLAQPTQRAIAVHLDGRETLLLFVDYSGAARQFGWVVPVPSTPEVELAHADAWNQLAGHYRDLQVQAWKTGKDRYDHDKSCSRAGDLPPDVDVRLQKTVGAYEIAVLAASKAGALHAWLAANGFVTPAGTDETLAAYVAERWSFVAIKVKAETAGTVSLSPIAIRFATDRLVYPLRISAANRGVTRLVLYTLDPIAEGTTFRDDYPAAQAFAVGALSTFRERCPRLIERVPQLRDGERNLVLARHMDTLVPQLMRRLSDRIVRRAGALDLYGAGGSAGPLAYASALALASDNLEEAAWGRERLASFRADRIDRTTLVRELGEGGRAKLETSLATELETGEDQRNPGAMALLGVLAADHPVLVARLEWLAGDPRRGNEAIDTLLSVGSAPTRRALARIAAGKGPHCAGAAFRLAYSLHRNAIGKTERLVAARELLGLLDARVTSGDYFQRLSLALLRAWTGQELGVDWTRWRAYLDEHASDFAE